MMNMDGLHNKTKMRMRLLAREYVKQVERGLSSYTKEELIARGNLAPVRKVGRKKKKRLGGLMGIVKHYEGINGYDEVMKFRDERM
ncbi:MAG: hypothetical protein KBS34_01460 [Phascolarctobacterium sp.]|nr:hypothetical protein [Candidatus Phascolarctobacterium equi]